MVRKTDQYGYLCFRYILCHVLEDEKHVLLNCQLYSDLRNNLFNAAAVVVTNFDALDNIDKLRVIFSNDKLTRVCAKTCYLILQRRNFYLCK